MFPTPRSKNRKAKRYTRRESKTISIVGRWQGLNNQIIEFFKDGQIVIDDGQYIVSGTYELLGDEYMKLSLLGFAGAWIDLFYWGNSTIYY